MYYEVPGPATAQQDGRTEYWDGRTNIEMVRKYVGGWKTVSIKVASGTQESKGIRILENSRITSLELPLTSRYTLEPRLYFAQG